jgi:hypothetical protein
VSDFKKQQDLEFHQSAEKAKNKLLADLNKMNVKDVNLDEGLEEIEDPRSRNF